MVLIAGVQLNMGWSAGIENENEVTRVSRLLESITQVQNYVHQINVHDGGDTKVIVLGNTDSGKSTLIHALVGRTIEAEERRDKITMRIDPSQVLQGFRIGIGLLASGDPLLPTAYLHRYSADSSLVFWDIPGFDDPRGVDSDVTTLFAIDRVFAPPCRAKVLLTIDRDSLDTARGNDVLMRLKKLSRFFPNRRELLDCVSLVVTKQGWRADGTLSNPGEMLLDYLQSDEDGYAGFANPAERDDVVSIVHTLKNQGRIFSFPRPRTVGTYTDLAWREPLLADIVMNCFPNPTVNVYSDFASNPSVGVLMHNSTQAIGSALGELGHLFQLIGRVTDDSEVLNRTKEALDTLNALPNSAIDTPAKIAAQLTELLPRFQLNNADFLECTTILTRIRSHEAFLTLIDKLNGTNDGRTIWFRNVPNIVATIRAAALLPTSTIKAQIDRIAERTRHQQELRERRHHQELRERRHQEELIARMIAEMFQKNDKGCCVQ